MGKIDPKDLLAAGAHFGHKSSRWHPKMAPFIYGKRDGVHIIDLTKTVEMLEQATNFIEEVVAANGKVLIVGTKLQTQPVVKNAAEATNMPFVVERWMGGMLTNFKTMVEQVKRLKKLEAQKESGELNAKYNKLEVQRFQEEIDMLNLLFGGIKEIESAPSAMIVLDVVEDRIAVREANKLGIPVVGICDTNADPELIDYVIPANDDSIKTLNVIMDELKSAIESGKAKQKSKSKEETK